MITEEKRQVLEFFAQGRRQYKIMQFREAQKCFEAALKIDQNDGPSKVYFLRCQHYLENPPPRTGTGFS